MRKFLCVVLIALCLVPLAGCKKDEFVEVCSVTYSVGGVSTTLRSNFILENVEQCSEEEYTAADDNKQFWTYSTNFFFNIETSKNNIPRFDSETIVYLYNLLGYSKCAFSNVRFRYVEVKIISDNRITIKYDGHTTTVSTESYVIEYFN